jgi:hypothetical protein
MAHYAELNENNEVIYIAYMDNGIITDENGNEIEQLGVDHLHFHHGAERRWVRTSYNGNFRGFYASLGCIYREDLDRFILKQPYPSWNLDDSTFEWIPPTPRPTETQEHIDNKQYYIWSEGDYTLNNNGWILVNYEENAEPITE